ISTDYRLGYFGLQFKEPKALPVTTELRFNVEIREFHVMRRTFELNVTASPEIDAFTFRQSQSEFFDEGCNVRIGFHRTLPLLHTKDFFRNMNFHVLLHWY